MTRIRTLRLQEMEAVPVVDGTLSWLPLRRTLDIQAFGINGYRGAAAGDQVIEEHDETGGGAGRHEELYLVVTGRATFTLDGAQLDAPAGTLVFIPERTVRRAATAAEDGTTVVVVGGRVGEAFSPSPWEHWFLAAPHVDAGDWEKAADIVGEGLAEHPANPPLLYNLACYEARAGRHDEALEHLRQALELDPDKVRKWAHDDADLDPIRELPGFPV